MARKRKIQQSFIIVGQGGDNFAALCRALESGWRVINMAAISGFDCNNRGEVHYVLEKHYMENEDE